MVKSCYTYGVIINLLHFMIRGNNGFVRKLDQFFKDGFKDRVITTMSYLSEKAEWGKGVIINIKKCHPFLLEVVKDWYKKNDFEGLIGDIDSLFSSKGEEDEHQKETNQRKFDVDGRVQRNKKQLFNILRKQKQLEPIQKHNEDLDE